MRWSLTPSGSLFTHHLCSHYLLNSRLYGHKSSLLSMHSPWVSHHTYTYNPHYRHTIPSPVPSLTHDQLGPPTPTRVPPTTWAFSHTPPTGSSSEVTPTTWTFSHTPPAGSSYTYKWPPPLWPCITHPHYLGLLSHTTSWVHLHRQECPPPLGLPLTHHQLGPPAHREVTSSTWAFSYTPPAASNYTYTKSPPPLVPSLNQLGPPAHTWPQTSHTTSYVHLNTSDPHHPGPSLTHHQLGPPLYIHSLTPYHSPLCFDSLLTPLHLF